MKLKHFTKIALVLPVLLSAVMIGGAVSQRTVMAAEGELYANGGFDNFFGQDYNLTLRNWNTFTSLASSDAIGDIAKRDDPAFVGYDPYHEGNHVIRLAHTERAEVENPTYFSTFYTHFNRSLASVSSEGGKLEISFDLKVTGWEKEDYEPVGSDGQPSRLYFQFEGRTDAVLLSPEASVLEEKGASYEKDFPGGMTYVDYSSYPQSDSLDGGYRRVTATFGVTEAQLAGSAVTVWFYNLGEYTAYIDHFQVKFHDTVILSEDFETFDLTIWACSDPAQTDPWKNWGVSKMSENSSYSPAKLIEDNGDYAVRFRRAQGVFTYSKSGSLVDYFLGGSKIFASAGIYKISADIKITGGKSSRLDLELTDADNVQTQGVYTNLLSGGNSYYNALPDSTVRAGYKHFEYLFQLTADQSQLLDSICFVFDTASGDDVLFLDNLSVTEATAGAPKLVWQSASALDLSERTNYLFAVDIGSTEASLDVTYNGKTEPVSPEYYAREGNVFNIDYRLFDYLGYKGEYEFTVTNSAGSAKTAVTVSGETGLPSAAQREYIWYQSGDLSVGVDLKSARILSVSNDGITLQANEYTLSQDGNAIILRENCLKSLINDENTFVVVTSGGSFNFTVLIREAIQADTEGLPPWAIGVIVSGSAIAVAGLSVGGVMLYKNRKKDMEGKNK